MLAEATLVLADLSSEGAPEMTVLVEGDVTSGRDFLSGTSARKFGPWRAIAAVWGRPEEGVGLERGEGGQTLIDRAQDLVDKPDNAWRVMEALASAFDRKREATQMATYREIIGGLSILQKHAEKGADSHDVEGQHDIIYGGGGEGLSPEEKAELERLGALHVSAYREGK